MMTKTILLVDDEPDMREMLGLRLRKSGYKVITAATGEECIQKAVENYPDLILLDILLPGMSGFEVTRQLKAKNITKDIPVIMVTALIGKDAGSYGHECGSDYFISKPFDTEELLCKIKAILEKGNIK